MSEMKLDRSGFILYTLKYQECLHFYKEVLGFSVLFEQDALCCFEFGGSYLMVEVDDEFTGKLPTNERIRTCLRMNVDDVEEYAKKVQGHGIAVKVGHHSWGSVAKFFDPDGNLCAFKDSRTFENQVLEGNTKH